MLLHFEPRMSRWRMQRAVKRVWFLACPGTGLLNIANPWEVLGHTNDVLGRAAYDLQLFGPGGPLLMTGHGVGLTGVRALPAAIRRPPDLVVVAGSSRRNPLAEPETKVVAWLRRHHERVARIVSICTGAFLLGEAGLLDGRRATTHWKYLKDLGVRFPKARVVDEGIFARDGKVWTSAGLTAGVDLTLALVEEDHGHDVAMAVARRMVLFLRRSGNQAQFSPVLKRQAEEPPKLRDLEGFVLERLERPLSVGAMAAGLGMSPRTLTRWCRAHLDESPAELVRRLRLDEARRLLEETELPLKDIAVRTGLGDPSTLWRVFGQYLGVTPAVYRERFASLTAS
jgi:transcriptional regulator GlxA family with amidase domain